MPTRVYIDGYNLYYGLKQHNSSGVNYRWLDLHAFSQALLPNTTIDRIRYFTAEVKGSTQSQMRQRIYWRALETLPMLEIHYGQFLSGPTWQPLAHPLPAIPANIPANVLGIGRSGLQLAQIIKTEEKGSDVNLATYLLLDCFRKLFDQAIVITNDSDLAEPIRVVTQEFGCKVWVFNPNNRNSGKLRAVSTYYVQIQPHHYQTSMFANVLHDQHGTIHKPTGW